MLFKENNLNWCFLDEKKSTYDLMTVLLFFCIILYMINNIHLDNPSVSTNKVMLLLSLRRVMIKILIIFLILNMREKEKQKKDGE